MLVKPCVKKLRNGYRDLPKEEWTLDEIRDFYVGVYLKEVR